MSNMRNDTERGYIDALLVPLIIVGVLLLGCLGFALWAFSGRQDYKNNSDQKVSKAVEAAVQSTQKTDAAKYAEDAKNPLKTYVGPSAFGSITVSYPRTWSAYIIEGDNSGTALNGYFHPDVVPNVLDIDSAMSLHIQVTADAYDQVLNQFGAYIQQKKAAAQPYAFPKVPSVIGTRIDGQIGQSKQGTAIVVPLRNLTMIVSSESKDYANDFNNIIVPNLLFSP
jgi:hypothetical protein